jgi:hypothetical protein
MNADIEVIGGATFPIRIDHTTVGPHEPDFNSLEVVEVLGVKCIVSILLWYGKSTWEYIPIANITRINVRDY